MKKEYMTPDFDIRRLMLCADVLGDSKLEDSDNPIYNDPDVDDPFG